MADPSDSVDVDTAARDLERLVDYVTAHQKHVTITRDGKPAAVLLSADELESIQETLYWLSVPDIKEDLAEAEADIRAGLTFSEEQIRTEFNVPKRDT